MIVRIQGKLDYVGEDCVHVTSGDTTRELLIPASEVAGLQSKIGALVSFFTMEYIEGNASFGQLAPKMIGFLRQEDKDFFDLFTNVKGIGYRKALRAMAWPIGDIAAAIALKDAKKLTQLPEIGKKTAETMILELHGKIEKFAVGAMRSANMPAASVPDYESQAVEVLVKLGEKRSEAENWVHRVCQADPTLQDAPKIVQGVFRLRGPAR